MTLDLRPDERRFLELMAPFGLDWETSVASYEARFGRGSYHGEWDVISLPAQAALTREPLVFHMHADVGDRSLPPVHVWADYRRSDDARENHRELVAQLEATLGPSTRADTSNCLKSVFPFGVFSAVVHTFPPELQPAFLRRPGANPLLDRNPELRVRASLALESDYALVRPDPNLLPIAELLEKKAWWGETTWIETPLDDGRLAAIPDRRSTRRTPEALARQIPRGRLLAFRDDANGRYGLVARRDAYRFERDGDARLVLLHLEPARGPGGYELSHELAPRDGAAKKPPVVLLGRDVLGKDAEGIATAMATLFRLPLVHARALDD